MRDELGEIHLIEKLSQILNIWVYVKYLMVISEKVHNNFELSVGIYNICECLV